MPSLPVLALAKTQTAATFTSAPDCYQKCAKSASASTGKFSNSSNMYISTRLLPNVCQVCQCWHCRIYWQWHTCQCWHWSGAAKPNGYRPKTASKFKVRFQFRVGQICHSSEKCELCFIGLVFTIFKIITRKPTKFPLDHHITCLYGIHTTLDIINNGSVKIFSPHPVSLLIF